VVLSSFALLLLAAGPTVAVPGFTGVNVDASEAAFYSDLLGQDLSRHGFKVVSAGDVQTMLGIERQKQLLGCGDDSCVGEIAGALNADATVVGKIAKLDPSYTVGVRMLSKTGEVLATFTTTVSRSSNVPAAMAEAARSIAHQLAGVLKRPELEPPGTTLLQKVAIAPVVAGGLAVIMGVVAQGMTQSTLSQLQMAPTVSAAAQLRDQGNTWQPASFVLLGVGALALVIGVVLLIAGRPE
jgi:hypothetical protein